MNGVKKRILIVDDEERFTGSLKTFLEQTGLYEVRVTHRGEDAIPAVKQFRPDLLLLDVMMPDMDGYEVCRRLKADFATCDIPVIFVTARVKTADEVFGLSLGAADYLSKPIIPAIVRARVGTQIALRAARRELEQKNLILSEEKELLEEIVTRMHEASPFDDRHVRQVQRSLEKTAGDISLSACRPDGTQHVLVGDFSGHGLTAAFSGPLVSWMFYHMTQRGCDLRDILREINQTLYRQLPSRLYMAASALAISPGRDCVQVWNHGLPPVLCVSGGMEPLRVHSDGLPFGMSGMIDEFEPHAAFGTAEAMCIYQYTDGITEASSPEREWYGQESTERLVCRIFCERLPLDSLWEALDVHCAGQGLTDDAVLVETRVGPST